MCSYPSCSTTLNPTSSPVLSPPPCALLSGIWLLDEMGKVKRKHSSWRGNEKEVGLNQPKCPSPLVLERGQAAAGTQPLYEPSENPLSPLQAGLAGSARGGGQPAALSHTPQGTQRQPRVGKGCACAPDPPSPTGTHHHGPVPQKVEVAVLSEEVPLGVRGVELLPAHDEVVGKVTP